MQIHFLGGATTVTGSQYLLETGRARILIDCGMFQGSPNESIRNRIPFAFEPGSLDAVLLTHAHLDHCGLLPLLVKEGYAGPIHATAGTIELATLVLLDSGKLHEEFAKREARWEKRHLPSLLGATILLFGNAFGAYATAYALTGGNLNLVTIVIGAQIRGDVLNNPGLGYALALGMVVIMALSIALYTWLQSKTARWLRQ